jgi:hypothetical protein
VSVKLPGQFFFFFFFGFCFLCQLNYPDLCFCFFFLGFCFLCQLNYLNFIFLIFFWILFSVSVKLPGPFFFFFCSTGALCTGFTLVCIKCFVVSFQLKLTKMGLCGE